MLEIVPMTLKEANAFVEQNHQHHGKVVGHKYSIGLSDGEKIVGVAIVGGPSSPEAVRLGALRFRSKAWAGMNKRNSKNLYSQP